MCSSMAVGLLPWFSADLPLTAELTTTAYRCVPPLQGKAAIAARTAGMAARLEHQAAEDRDTNMQRQHAAEQKRKAEKVILVER